MYVYAPNNTPAAYPFGQAAWKELNAGVSVRRLEDMPVERLAEFDVFPVVSTASPAPSDPITKNVREDWPSFDGTNWNQQWIEEDATPEQIAARQERAAVEDAKTDAVADTFVQQLVSNTPAQVDSWIDSNVTDINSAKALFKNMARMLRYFAKKELG